MKDLPNSIHFLQRIRISQTGGQHDAQLLVQNCLVSKLQRFFHLTQIQWTHAYLQLTIHGFACSQIFLWNITLTFSP